MPRPDRNRQPMTLNLSPDTIQTVKQLAHERQTYPGDIIDRAVQEMTMETFTITATKDGQPLPDTAWPEDADRITWTHDACGGTVTPSEVGTSEYATCRKCGARWQQTFGENAHWVRIR